MVDRQGPNRIKVLQVNVDRVTLDVALATDELPGHETPSSMARRHGAIAATNGDYTIRPGTKEGGRPVNAFAEDGEVKSTSLIWGRNFAYTQDESSFLFGHYPPAITLTQLDLGETWPIRKVNEGPPKRHQFAAFTPAGGTVFGPHGNACSIRLYPISDWTISDTAPGLYQDLTVDELRCDGSRMPRRRGTVITAEFGSRNAGLMSATILPGETVRMQWSMGGLPNVYDTVGGNPTLIEDGAVTVEPCDDSYFCYRNPRTGVGMRGDGHLLMVVVDGRRRSSVGMTPPQFARLFRYLSAEWALMFDGGGASSMVVRNRVINTPSDGRERPVGSALLVLPRGDSGEVPQAYPTPTPTPTLTPAPTPTPTETPSPTTSPTPSESPAIVLPLPPPYSLRTGDVASCLSMLDPASTGGLLDAMSKGLVDGPRRVPRWARTGLDVFTGRRSCPGIARLSSSLRRTIQTFSF